ncbi:MAG: quinolinate synthase NadA [Caldiserica bacterium]|nr:quinolinate synthase NadA [Caldisericota bacterium]
MDNFEKKQIRQELTNRDMLLLAHNYQVMVVQECADLVGDSLELSKAAKNARQQKIMFAAVYFMAETAAIMTPEKQIMIAAKDAGCPGKPGSNRRGAGCKRPADPA